MLEDLVLIWSCYINSNHGWHMCRHRYSSHRQVLTSVVFYVKYLNWSLQFSEVSFAKPRFLASFHKSKDVEAPAFLPGWDMGARLDGACRVVQLGLLSHTPWRLIPCVPHLLMQSPDPVRIWLCSLGGVCPEVCGAAHAGVDSISLDSVPAEACEVSGKCPFFNPLNDLNFLEAVDLI